MTDTSTLFEHHTIQEIIDIEKKLRQDIERKKEELRQMVGERYRDLMDAADTITEMKTIAEDVNCRINSIEVQFNKLQYNNWYDGVMNSVHKKVEERKKKNENTYTIFCLIKILIDAPAKIWAFIENENYLDAMQVFLLARHTHSTLVLDPLYTKQQVLASFPIINKQWTSIYHFQFILLQKSQELLLCEKINADNFVGPLCCLAFLSDASLVQVFEDLLAARKVAIFSIFKPEKSAKSQVCELVNLIQNTLESVHVLFYPGAENSEDKSNLLLHTVHRIMNHNEAGPIVLMDQLQASPMIQYLPKDISGYRPSLKITAQDISVEHLQKYCDNWLINLKSELVKALDELLDYVATIKGLAMIRDTITTQLTESSSWDKICQHLLQKKLSVWDFFLKESFIKRIHTIISYKTDNAKNLCIKEIDKTFKDFQNKDPRVKFEENISEYIWTESENDLPPNLGWFPHHQRPLWESGSLGLKSWGLTPKVQSICCLLDKKLENLLDDISHFTKKPKDVAESAFYWNSQDISEDSKIINTSLATVTKVAFSELIQHLNKTLNELKEETDILNSSASVKIIFLGHLCSGLSKLSPHLMKCLQLDNPRYLRSLSLSSSGAGDSTKEENSWAQLKDNLLQLCDRSFKKWSAGIIKNIIENFNSELTVCSPEGILKALLQWDKIEIQEESEEGEAVMSVLRIPQQISVPLHNCLFQFCQELNKIGGHSLNRQLRSEIREDFLLHLLITYKNKSNESWPEDIYSSHLAQTQSLQLLFDVQFLMGLMPSKDSTEASKISKETIEKIMSSIDPFDMDVFSTHLQSNTKKALQKSVLLLGLVASPDQVNYLSGLKSPLSSQIDHNLMLMPTSTTRLPLLPFATRTTTSTTLTESTSSSNLSDLSVQTTSTLKSTHSSSPNFNISDNLTNVLKSSSFYDRVTAMSSSWFGS